MSKILIIGEAYGEQEEAQNRPFVGPSGSLLNGVLAQAGIDRRECTLTNVFNFRPPNNNIAYLTTNKRSDGVPGYPPIVRGKWLRAEYAPHLEKMWELIRRKNPNVIFSLGNTPLWALCGKLGIKKHRGAPLLTRVGEFKVVPSWHPAAVLRQFSLRPVLFMDAVKVRRHSESPLLIRPARKITLRPTIEEAWEFYEKYLKDAARISCDVETKGGQITEVGYAPSRNRALVIPFWDRAQSDGNYWRTLEEERSAWELVRLINSTKSLFGQNFSYDVQYFWKDLRIPCPQFDNDTMLLHHALQPELQKGLGFLGSVYTDEPIWKTMRTDHSTLKKDD